MLILEHWLMSSTFFGSMECIKVVVWLDFFHRDPEECPSVYLCLDGHSLAASTVVIICSWNDCNYPHFSLSPIGLFSIFMFDNKVLVFFFCVPTAFVHHIFFILLAYLCSVVFLFIYCSYILCLSYVEWTYLQTVHIEHWQLTLFWHCLP